MRDYLQERGRPDELQCIDVTAHITKGFPPVFLMTSNRDFLREQAPLLSRTLEANGVPFIYRCYGDTQNPLGHVFHCDIKSRSARLCNDEECAFFRGFL